MSTALSRAWCPVCRQDREIEIDGNTAKCTACGNAKEIEDDDDSGCFITTAVHSDPVVVGSLRDFRDRTMRPSLLGEPLLALYETLSPPIAATLAEYPESFIAKFLRWTLYPIADLAQYNERVNGMKRTATSIVLVLLYLTMVLIAAIGHAYLRIKP